MQIIKIHYKVSKPVSNYKEIKAEVNLMRRFIVRGDFKGFYNKAFVIAHKQVSETPMSFFVVSPDVMEEKMFKSDVIINPEILFSPTYKEVTGDSQLYSGKSADGKDAKQHIVKMPNGIEYQEPCLSFPFRKPKRLMRYNEITVRYQIKTLFGLKTVDQDLDGLASQIFQHAFDHTQGKNIYFESENPVKWWEQIGKEKSKGGTSLDAPEDLELQRSGQKETKNETINQ